MANTKQTLWYFWKFFCLRLLCLGIFFTLLIFVCIFSFSILWFYGVFLCVFMCVSKIVSPAMSFLCFCSVPVCFFVLFDWLFPRHGEKRCETESIGRWGRSGESMGRSKAWAAYEKNVFQSKICFLII